MSDHEQASIFDAVEKSSSRYRDKPRSPRPVARLACGMCMAQKVSLDLSGDREHLIWRFHNYETWGGNRLPCRASFTRLCDAPARDIAGIETPVCICERNPA